MHQLTKFYFNTLLNDASFVSDLAACTSFNLHLLPDRFPHNNSYGYRSADWWLTDVDVAEYPSSVHPLCMDGASGLLHRVEPGVLNRGTCSNRRSHRFDVYTPLDGERDQLSPSSVGFHP